MLFSSTCLVVGEVQDLHAVRVGDVCGLGLSVEVDLSTEQVHEAGLMIGWGTSSVFMVTSSGGASDLTTLWSVISLVSPLKKVTLTVCPSADTSFLVPLGKTTRRSPLARTVSV